MGKLTHPSFVLRMGQTNKKKVLGYDFIYPHSTGPGRDTWDNAEVKKEIKIRI